MACNCFNDCTDGCPVHLDTACIFYHKDNNEVSELTGLNISNGATLELILESIDEKIKQLNVAGFSLPVLRASGAVTINTLQQFAQAVDTKFGLLSADVATALAASQQVLSATDTSTIDFSLSGALNHTLTASVKLSTGLAGNRLTAQSDGLHVTAQSLSVNYTTKKLTISDGNTVDLAAITCGASGFLGNFSADPTAIDGQYWYNTTSPNVLKIKVNGLVKTIALS